MNARESSDGAETDNKIGGGRILGHVFQGRDFSLNMPSSAPNTPAQLPPLVAGFVGRDHELAQLTSLLEPASTAGAVVVSAVAGLAGVGKTSLVIQAGHAARENGWFAGGVMFIDLHGYDKAPVMPPQSLDALLRCLGAADQHIPPSVEERSTTYRSALAGIADPVLIVLDNASSEAQVLPLLPGLGPHRVIVTSRHTLAGLDARLLEVGVLAQHVAVDLLDSALRAARPDDDRVSSDVDSAILLARICGGLPLGLKIAAATMRADARLSIRELCQELETENERLKRLRYGDDNSAGMVSVEAAFELSYRRLDVVPARVFRLMPVCPGRDVSTDATAAVADLPTAEARKALRDLARAHLIEATPGMGGRWRMHDLMRLLAQRLSNENAEMDRRHLSLDRLLGYYLATADAADDHLHVLPPGQALSPRFADRTDALTWFDGERQGLVAAVRIAADTGRDQVALHLPRHIAEYLRWRRRFDDLLVVAGISVSAAHRIGDQYEEGRSLRDLGISLYIAGKKEEALDAHRSSVAIYRAFADRHGEGGALYNLAIALLEVKNYEEAMAAGLEAGAIFRETGDRNGEGKALLTVGFVMWSLGRRDEAVAACEDAASILGETGDLQGQGTALRDLGAFLAEQAFYDRALAACEDAAQLLRATADSHGEGMTLYLLGIIFTEQENYLKAIAPLRNALTIFRETGDMIYEEEARKRLEGIRAILIGRGLAEAREEA